MGASNSKDPVNPVNSETTEGSSGTSIGTKSSILSRFNIFNQRKEPNKEQANENQPQTNTVGGGKRRRSKTPKVSKGKKSKRRSQKK